MAAPVTGSSSATSSKLKSDIHSFPSPPARTPKGNGHRGLVNVEDDGIACPIGGALDWTVQHIVECEVPAGVGTVDPHPQASPAGQAVGPYRTRELGTLAQELVCRDCLHQRAEPG